MLLGLTGNFGSGKSTVLKMFQRLGAITVSSDDIVHDILTSPGYKASIIDLLGDILDNRGEIDKRKVARLIFNNESLRKALEGFIHPIVIEEIQSIHRKNRSNLVVAEIPLLFEGGFEETVDKIVTIWIDQKLVLNRLRQRGFSEDDIRSRMACQIPDERKIDHSDFVINNSSTLEETEAQVRKIIKSEALQSS